MCLPSVGFICNQLDYDMLMCVAFIWFVNKYMKCMLIYEMLFDMNWKIICELPVEACFYTTYVEWCIRVAFAHIEWTIYAHAFHGTC